MAVSCRTPDSQAWSFRDPVACSLVINSCAFRGPREPPRHGHLTTQQWFTGQDQKGPFCSQQEEPVRPAAWQIFSGATLCYFPVSLQNQPREEEVWGGQWAHRARLRFPHSMGPPPGSAQSPSVERVRARQDTSPNAAKTRMLPVR